MKRIVPILLMAAVAAAQTPPQQASPQPQPPRRREVTPEGRQKIEAALPAKAPARPHRARKLLVVDFRAGHPSVPYANLAVELMGTKTGAYETVLSHDMSMFTPEKLKQFDAVYLNNTVGVPNDVFSDPDARIAFAAYIRNGGGLVGNHGTSVASPKWPGFVDMLGATGAAHRAADEKVWLKLDDPSHPLNAPFGGKGFEFTEEIFRFLPPSPRSKVHVLFSIDTSKTDMNQGRCTSNCTSEDGEYPLSWVRSYGKGRVFYCALGHNPDPFWDERLLLHFLSGIQFALGDLKVNTKPTLKSAVAR
jgi:type 1 glutamine amidotransferase